MTSEEDGVMPFPSHAYPKTKHRPNHTKTNKEKKSKTTQDTTLDPIPNPNPNPDSTHRTPSGKKSDIFFSLLKNCSTAIKLVSHNVFPDFHTLS